MTFFDQFGVYQVFIVNITSGFPIQKANTYINKHTHTSKIKNLLPSMAISQVVDIGLFSPRAHMMIVIPEHQPTNKGQKANTISNNAFILTVQQIFQLDDESFLSVQIIPFIFP